MEPCDKREALFQEEQTCTNTIKSNYISIYIDSIITSAKRVDNSDKCDSIDSIITSAKLIDKRSYNSELVNNKSFDVVYAVNIICMYWT